MKNLGKKVEIFWSTKVISTFKLVKNIGKGSGNDAAHLPSLSSAHSEGFSRTWLTIGKNGPIESF